jgi:transposase
MGHTLTLTLGVRVGADGAPSSYVHYRIEPPASEAHAADALFAQDWEVNRRSLCPSFGQALREGRTQAIPKASLVAFLREHNVSCRAVTSQEIRDESPLAARLFARADGRPGPLTKDGLVAIATRMCTHGLAGLAKAGGTRVLAGGGKRRVRGTTESFHGYLQALSRDAADPASDAHLPNLDDRRLLLDNASFHGAIRRTDRKSYMHRLAREKYGLRNVVFLPPVTPVYSPAERCFGWLKNRLRRQTPSAGFTDAGLVVAVEDAMAELRRSQFVVNWFLGCGYLFDPTGNAFFAPPPTTSGPSARDALLADLRARLLEPDGCAFRDAVVEHNRQLEAQGKEPLIANVGTMPCVGGAESSSSSDGEDLVVAPPRRGELPTTWF